MAASSPSPLPLPLASEKPRRPRFSEGPCNTTAPNFDFALDPYEETKHAAFAPEAPDQLATQPTWTTAGSHDARGPGRQEAPPALSREKAGFGTILADLAAIMPPFALLAFAAVLLARDGYEVSQEAYSRWKNAATVVSAYYLQYQPTNRPRRLLILSDNSSPLCSLSSLLPLSAASCCKLPAGNSRRAAPSAL